MSTKCIGCGLNSRRTGRGGRGGRQTTSKRKLVSVPSQLINQFLMNGKVIIKCSHKICTKCLNEANELKLAETPVPYSGRYHTLSGKWIKDHVGTLINSVNKQQKKIGDQQQQIDHLENELNVSTLTTTKYKRRPINNNNNLQTLNQDIPDVSNSNKWHHHLLHNLHSNSDCFHLTGFDRMTINKQAVIAGANAEWIFHLRVRMKLYIDWMTHALIYGMSPPTLTKGVDAAMKLMNEKYAKPKLIHSLPNTQQYWDRDMIKNHTPKFVYKLLGIDPNQKDVVIATADSTYQFTLTCQSSHDIRKGTHNVYKGNRQLIKVHIYSALDGSPFYPMFVFSDGHHADTQIYKVSLDTKYIKECLKSLQGGNEDKIELKDDQENNIFVVDEKTCHELLKLQDLIQMHDKIIVDGGYLVDDPRKIQAASPPKVHKEPENGRLSVLEASYKRMIGFMRQVQERLHRYIKRFKFLRTEICVEDIPRIPAIWNIALSDIIHEDIKLMQDSDRTDCFVDRMLDMRYVSINPIDIYASPQKRKKTKTQRKKACIDEDEDEHEQIENESESESDKEIDAKFYKHNRAKYKTVAKGWDEISDYILKEPHLKEIFTQCTKEDIKSFIGRCYSNNNCLAYLRRCKLNSPKLTLQINTENPLVWRFHNVKSKYKSAQRYDIMVSVDEHVLYNESVKKYKNKDESIQISKSEQHWLKWLENGQPRDENNVPSVAQYLDISYKNDYKILQQIREAIRKKKRKYIYGKINFGKFKKSQLIKYCEENSIEIQEKATNKSLRMIIVKTLKERQEQCTVEAEKTNIDEKQTKNVQKEPNWFELSEDELETQCDEINWYKKCCKGWKSFSDVRMNDLRKWICHHPHIHVPYQQNKRHYTKDTALRYVCQYYYRKQHNLIATDHRNDADDEQQHVVHATQCVDDIEEEGDEETEEESEKEDSDGSTQSTSHDVAMDIDNESTTTETTTESELDEYIPDSSMLSDYSEEIERKLQQELEGEALIDSSDEDMNPYINYQQNRTEIQDLPSSLKYLKKYPKEKWWFDINFELFNSFISRLQYRCTCRSGAQLPGCCAHVGTILWLLWYTCNCKRLDNDLLRESKRDCKIKKSILDLTLYKKWEKMKNEEKKDITGERGCLCNNDDIDEELIKCDSCSLWYHPSCCNTTWKDIQHDKWTQNVWWCNICEENTVYVIRNIGRS